MWYVETTVHKYAISYTFVYILVFQGTCVCEDNFIAPDCSVDERIPPDVLGIRGEGLCDTSESTCRTIFAVGQDIYKSQNLSCNIQSFDVSEILCPVIDPIGIFIGNFNNYTTTCEKGYISMLKLDLYDKNNLQPTLRHYFPSNNVRLNSHVFTGEDPQSE